MLQGIKRFLHRLSSGKGMVAKEGGGTRYLILHNHIFKHAGSTVDWALQRNFGDRFLEYRDDKTIMQQEELLKRFLEENSHLDVLSTHNLRHPIPKLDGKEVLELLIFRHPIERVMSVYNFERKQVHATNRGPIHARKMSLNEYVEWRMRPDVGGSIRNIQTRHCIVKKRMAKPVTEKEFAQAVEHVKNLPLLGMVERFDESMVLVEERLKPIFPGIDMAYVRQNVSQSDEKKKSAVELLREELTDDVWQLLQENNLYDKELYDLTNRLLDERMAATDRFDEKLADFKNRCAKLGG